MTQATLHSATADAVLQAAIQMEELGKDFYDALAAAIGDRPTVELCRKLAAAEVGHLAVFRQMRSELAHRGETVLLPDCQLAEARQVAKHTVLPDQDAICRMVSAGDVEQLFEMAIRMENESVRFYRMLAGQLPDPAAVDGVIREEEEHVRLLSAARTRHGGAM